jgi:acyl carrier protein
MMVDETVVRVVLDIARTHRPELDRVQPEQALVDELGFDSLDIAQLVAVLEDELSVDPFATTAISRVRTVGDLCEVYRRALAG